MATIEDILLQRAAREEAQQPQQLPMIAAGSGIGAYLGQAVGGVPQDLVNIGRQITGRKRGIVDRLNPNAPRMAGGLLGMIIGGGLGEAVRQMTLRESPAARVLAKIQTQGSVTPEDKMMLENILADTYSKPSQLA